MAGTFDFLRAEWRDVHEAAAAVYPDPRTACFYSRRALELAVSRPYKSDASLHLPYQDNLSALIHDPSFKSAAGEAVFNKARISNTLGHQAVHSHRQQQTDAKHRSGQPPIIFYSNSFTSRRSPTSHLEARTGSSPRHGWMRCSPFSIQ